MSSVLLVNAAVPLAAAPAARPSPAVKLRIAHIHDESYPWHKAFERFRDLVHARAKGEIDVQIFARGQLGTEKDYISYLRLGTLDMATVSTGGLSEVAKEAALFDLMFLWKDHDHWERALDGDVGRQMADAIRRATTKQGVPGFEVLGYWGGSELHVVSRTRGYQTVKELEGLKIRSQGTDVQVEQWKALGALPQTVPYNAIYEALRSGNLEATPGIVPNVYTMKFYEVAPHISETAHAFIVRPCVMSGHTWSKLSPAQRKLVADAAAEATTVARALESQQNQEYAQTLKTRFNVKFHPFRERDLLRERTQRLREQTAADLGLRGVLKGIEGEADRR